MVNGISVAVYLLWLAVSGAAALYAVGWRGIWARLKRYWPVAFVVGSVTLTFLLANRYDWSEADRLKFVIEPFVIVIGVWAIHAAVGKRQRSRVAHRVAD